MKYEITDDDIFNADSLKVSFIVNQYMAIIDVFLSRSRERGGKCGFNNCLNNIVRSMVKSNRSAAVNLATGILEETELTNKVIAHSDDVNN